MLKSFLKSNTKMLGVPPCTPCGTLPLRSSPGFGIVSMVICSISKLAPDPLAGVGLGFAVGLAVGLGLGLGVGFGVAVGLGLGLGFAVGLGLGLGLGFAVGFGLGCGVDVEPGVGPTGDVVLDVGPVGNVAVGFEKAERLYMKTPLR